MSKFAIGIIGAGGFAREVLAHMLSDGMRPSAVGLFVSESYLGDYPEASPISELDVGSTQVLVAVGDPEVRQRIVNSLPRETNFATFVHTSAKILADDVHIGHGSIICANSLLTTNIRLGEHCQLNLSTTIGHDCQIGDYFTASPSVNISGNCNIGNRVSLGTNSSVREKIKICSDVIVGLNSGVVAHIREPGTYAGLPARRIR